jgi:hypothetical protein
MQNFDCLNFKFDKLKSFYAIFPPILYFAIYLVTLIVAVGSMVTEKETKMKVKQKYCFILHLHYSFM